MTIEKLVMRLRGLAVTLTLTSICALAQAQAPYPTRPVKLIVPFPAGQATDIFARVLGQELAIIWGQPVVIDNKGGGNSIPGMIAGRDGAPDGYTLTMATSSTLAANPSMYSKLSYSPSDFALVNGVFVVPLMILAHPDAPYKNLKELVEAAKKNPGKLEWAYGATNQILAGELFKSRVKVDILAIPYKGSAQAMTDLLGGQVKLSVDTLPSALPHIKTGKIKPLAMMSAQRVPQLPDVPTVAEMGYPNFTGPGWGGIIVPKATPPELVEKISTDIRKALASPAVQQKIIDFGAVADLRDSKQWTEFVHSEVIKWAEIVKSANLKAD